MQRKNDGHRPVAPRAQHIGYYKGNIIPCESVWVVGCVRTCPRKDVSAGLVEHCQDSCKHHSPDLGSTESKSKSLMGGSKANIRHKAGLQNLGSVWIAKRSKSRRGEAVCASPMDTIWNTNRGPLLDTGSRMHRLAPQPYGSPRIPMNH